MKRSKSIVPRALAERCVTLAAALAVLFGSLAAAAAWQAARATPAAPTAPPAVIAAEEPSRLPAGPLAGSCPLIASAEIAQEGENVVVRLALAEITGEVQYTVETGYEGPWDNGPYFRLKLRKVY